MPKNKMKDFNFNVLNIKLQSTTIITPEHYKSLFENAFNQRKFGKIQKERFGIIRQLIQPSGKSYLYGIFCSSLIPDGKAFDSSKLEIIDFSIPKNIFINPKESQFAFFPDLHRMIVRTNSAITVNQLIKMLMNIFKDVLPENTALDISVQQSSDVFKLITESKYIASLHIEISPTNADISSDVTEFMDKELKLMHAEKLSADVKPNASGSLLFEDSKILSGMLGMAQNNGYVKAKILDENNKPTIINTKEHPERFLITAINIEEAWLKLYNKLKEKFRK